MMIIDNKYNIGDEVYLKTDIDQHKRLIIGIWITSVSSIIYELAQGVEKSWHTEQEITKEKTLVL